MKASVLLDSNIVIDAAVGRPLAFRELSLYQHHAISRINWIEVMSVRDPAQVSVLQGMTATFDILDVTEAVAWSTVQLRLSTRLKLADAIIYATALVHGLTLVTRNTKDFDASMPGVRIPYTI